MDAKANVVCIKEAVAAWIVGRQDELGAITLTLVELSSSSIILDANGELLQILVPSSFSMVGCCPLLTSTFKEGFLVTSMGSKLDEILESALMILNKKLERLGTTPDALNQALDLFLLTLKKIQLKRDRQLQSEGDDSEGASSKAQTSTPPDGSDFLNKEDESDGDSDLVEVDHYGYDLAVGEGVKSDMSFHGCSSGYLFKMAQVAKQQCEHAQKQKEICLDAFDYKAAICWSNMELLPDLLSIDVYLQIGDIMRDINTAATLGFSVVTPVKLSLQFSKESWEQDIYRPCTRPLKLDACTVTQEGRPSRETMSTTFPLDEFDDTTKMLRVIDQTHLYGNEVLMPELINAYFHFLAFETTPMEKKLESLDLFNRLRFCTKMENPFIGMICFLVLQLRALPDWCVVCWNLLPYSVCRLRTCDRELCLYRFEELGLGTPVLHEVQTFPELVDFEMSLALRAAHSSRDVFEPFPSFLLAKEELRGRSGWFSKVERVDYSVTTVHEAARSSSQHAISSNKRVDLLRAVLNSIPPLSTLKDCHDEQALKKTLSKHWLMKERLKDCAMRGKRLDEADRSLEAEKWPWLPYDVLRFILSTNRLSLHLLRGEEELITCGMCYQFAVLHDNPEREAHFQRRRAERGGSFFAFHGSKTDNWFSILRNGLRCLSNTAYMSSGASFGPGIYLSTNAATSRHYSSVATDGWTHGCLKNGFSVMSICEIVNGSLRTGNIDRPFSNVSNGVMVIPPENEKDVAIRYILVSNSVLSSDYSITGSTLSNSLDLKEHFQALRNSYIASQKQQQLVCKEAQWPTCVEVSQKKQDVLEKREQTGFQTIPSGGSSSKVEKKVDCIAEMSQNSASTRTVHSASALQAIVKEYKNIVKQIDAAQNEVATLRDTEGYPTLACIQVYLIDETDLSRWHVTLNRRLFKQWPLYKDLIECGRAWAVPEVSIKLECVFPGTYPFAPPFVRVVSPRFGFHTGHVTIGGSICMELLTESGWSPAYNFESVLVQIVNAMIEGGGRLDRASWSSSREYSECEAREAFDRVARSHGWLRN